MVRVLVHAVAIHTPDPQWLLRSAPTSLAFSLLAVVLFCVRNCGPGSMPALASDLICCC